MKYLKEIRSYFKNLPAFTLLDIKKFLNEKKPSAGYIRLMMYKLIEKGEIKRISKGIYTYKTDAQVVGFAFTPFYYGLQDALSLRNLWEQESNPVVITPRKVRSGLRIFETNNYLVRRISRKMFFGFEMIKYYDFWIPVSDAEKTLIDFIYFKEHLDKSTIKEIFKTINKTKLHKYLKKCSYRIREKILEML